MQEIVVNKTISVEGMSCPGCENSLEKAVSQLEGVKSVKADSQTGHVSLEYDIAKTRFEHIDAKIQDAGYSLPDNVRARNARKIIYAAENRAFQTMKMNEGLGMGCNACASRGYCGFEMGDQ